MGRWARHLAGRGDHQRHRHGRGPGRLGPRGTDGPQGLRHRLRHGPQLVVVLRLRRLAGRPPGGALDARGARCGPQPVRFCDGLGPLRCPGGRPMAIHLDGRPSRGRHSRPPQLVDWRRHHVHRPCGHRKRVHLGWERGPHRGAWGQWRHPPRVLGRPDRVQPHTGLARWRGRPYPCGGRLARRHALHRSTRSGPCGARHHPDGGRRQRQPDPGRHGPNRRPRPRPCRPDRWPSRRGVVRYPPVPGRLPRRCLWTPQRLGGPG